MLRTLRRVLLPAYASINDYERKVRSQFGEDGVIAELLRRLGATHRWFAEFGVADGVECNCAFLADAGWSGLMIEADEHAYQRLAHRYAGSPHVRTVHSFVTAENIAGIFAEQGVPTDLDVLSIDVDGNDYWLWQALGGYSPRIVVIEYNAAYPPPQRWVMRYDPTHHWDGTTYYGASLASLASLGERKGYALVGTTTQGVNAFFLRDDLLAASRFSRLSPEDAYHPPAYEGSDCKGTLGHPSGNGPSVEI